MQFSAAFCSQEELSILTLAGSIPLSHVLDARFFSAQPVGTASRKFCSDGAKVTQEHNNELCIFDHSERMTTGSQMQTFLTS